MSEINNDSVVRKSRTSEHPAQYARHIIDVELKRLYDQLTRETEYIGYCKTERHIKARAAVIEELKNKIKQLETADFCLHMEL
jgi:hypothetical protein